MKKKYRYIGNPYVPAADETPRFQHDCSKCIFLGRYNEYDLYVCPWEGKANTVIARRGDDGPDYSSGIFDSQMPTNPLGEALERALGLGYAPRFWPQSYKDEMLKTDYPYGMNFYLKYFVNQHFIEEPLEEASKAVYDRMTFLDSDWLWDLIKEV